MKYSNLVFGENGINLYHNEAYSISVYDQKMKQIGKTISAKSDDYDCALLLKANRLALGYWSSADLAIYDLGSGELLNEFPYRQISPLGTFDETGKKLLFKSGSKVLLLDIETSEAIQILGVGALDCMLVNCNHVVVPSRKKGELINISMETGGAEFLYLPIDATFFDLKQSPSSDQFVAIDKKKGLHCIDRINWSIVWSISLKKEIGKDHMGVGQFSGDGTLFGAAISAYDHNYTIVVDAIKGEQIGRIEPVCYDLPYKGTMVCNSSAAHNCDFIRTLDLATGKEGAVNLTNGFLADND